MDGGRRHIFSGSICEELTGSSRAVLVGDHIYVSNVIGRNEESGIFAIGAAAQATEALDSIERTLKEVESGLADIVRLRVNLENRQDFEPVIAVLRDRIGRQYPALTVTIAGNSLTDALVGIEVEAIRGSSA